MKKMRKRAFSVFSLGALYTIACLKRRYLHRSMEYHRLSALHVGKIQIPIIIVSHAHTNISHPAYI